MPELVHEIEVRPAFYDLDPMAVVWHGHYVKFFELARTALMQHFNYDYEQMRESGYLWPVVDMRLKYVRPATLHQPPLFGHRHLRQRTRAACRATPGHAQRGLDQAKIRAVIQVQTHRDCWLHLFHLQPEFTGKLFHRHLIPLQLELGHLDNDRRAGGFGAL